MKNEALVSRLTTKWYGDGQRPNKMAKEILYLMLSTIIRDKAGNERLGATVVEPQFRM